MFSILGIWMKVFVKINGKLCYLWRAVDHEREVLEAMVTARRDKAAALQLLKRIMRKYGAARRIVTDGLRAYSAAMNEIGVAAERHEVGGRLNNRAENSHQPFRRRERAMHVDALAAEGASPHDALANTDVGLPDLNSPGTRISISQLIQCYRNAIALSRDPHLPYTIGSRVHLSANVWLCHALQHRFPQDDGLRRPVSSIGDASGDYCLR